MGRQILFVWRQIGDKHLNLAFITIHQNLYNPCYYWFFPQQFLYFFPLPHVGRDGNCTIKYFELKDKTRIGDINIDAGKTIQGNDRTPKGNFADFMGPFPSLDLADRGDTDGR